MIRGETHSYERLDPPRLPVRPHGVPQLETVLDNMEKLKLAATV